MVEEFGGKRKKHKESLVILDAPHLHGAPSMIHQPHHRPCKLKHSIFWVTLTKLPGFDLTTVSTTNKLLTFRAVLATQTYVSLPKFLPSASGQVTCSKGS